eukprot:scaffold4663_cov104-Isochrysis_galbana.AAC.5
MSDRSVFGPPATNIGAALTGAPMRRGPDVKEGVDGNWKCTQCSNINFGARQQCNRCSAEKPPEDVLQQRWDELSARRKPLPVEGVDGNWACTACTNVNWFSRDTCKKCAALRPPDEILEARKLELQLNPAAPPTKPTQDLVNWRCVGCANINWSQRLNCSRCGAGCPQSFRDVRTPPGMAFPPFSTDMLPSGMPAGPGVARAGAPAAYAAGLPVANAGLGGFGMHLYSETSGTAAVYAALEALRQRQGELEAQMAALQAALLPQVSSLSVALQQLQVHVLGLHAQVSAQLLASMGVHNPALPELHPAVPEIDPVAGGVGRAGGEAPPPPPPPPAACAPAEAPVGGVTADAGDGIGTRDESTPPCASAKRKAEREPDREEEASRARERELAVLPAPAPAPAPGQQPLESTRLEGVSI